MHSYSIHDNIGLPPDLGGNGGDDSDDGPNVPDYRDRLRRCRVGLVVGLAPIVMLFVALTSAYIIRQNTGQWDPHSSAYINDWVPVHLPMFLLGLNTVMLILSSISMEFARRQVMRESLLAPLASIPGIKADDASKFPWLSATTILGIAFLIGQYLAWQALAASGFYLASGPSSQFVYILTGAHAVHLLGGVITLLFALRAAWLCQPVSSRRIAVDISAWYWHFMGVLWLYIFGLLYFLK